MPWASSRPPPGNSQSANDIVDTLCCPGINIIKKKKRYCRRGAREVSDLSYTFGQSQSVKRQYVRVY